jgi:hypothetical protein
MTARLLRQPADTAREEVRSQAKNAFFITYFNDFLKNKVSAGTQWLFSRSTYGKRYYFVIYKPWFYDASYLH